MSKKIVATALTAAMALSLFSTASFAGHRDHHRGSTITANGGTGGSFNSGIFNGNGGNGGRISNAGRASGGSVVSTNGGNGGSFNSGIGNGNGGNGGSISF